MSVIAIVKSQNGVPIRLTKERWNHITTSHLDMENNQEAAIETTQNPDMMLRGIADEMRAVRFFPKTHLGPKHVVVAYKEVSPWDGFVLTAYKTSKVDKIMKRGVIWKR